jgi:sugar/nucleoside kinase (ribokinase family)
MTAFHRLVSLGTALVDLQLFVPELPTSGGDVLADDSLIAIGGSFNVESAAARVGMKVVHTGSNGSGPNSKLLSESLAREHIEFAGETFDDADLGVCVTMVEPNGERTFVTRNGAESKRTLVALNALRLGPTDAVYLAGYDLAYPQSKDVFKTWLRSDPLNGAALFFDPTPLVASIDPELLELVRQNAFAVTANEHETKIIGLGENYPGWFVNRVGSRGAELYEQGVLKGRFDATKVQVVDTTGAGDVHTGVLIASLAAGFNVPASIERANRAAAISITKRGGASGPDGTSLNESFV